MWIHCFQSCFWCHWLTGVKYVLFSYLIGSQSVYWKEPRAKKSQSYKVYKVTKFCAVLISSQEVMKLQSFQSGVSDLTPANVKKKILPWFFSLIPWISSLIFIPNSWFLLILRKNNLLHSLLVVLTISHKPIKSLKFWMIKLWVA